MMEPLQIFVQLLKVLIFDAVVLAIFLACMVPLKNKKYATYAVMKRDFVGYFSNPTGYVFICVFMLLSSIAAFWPDEFFNANLATLDQLNLWFPMIMLVFIPAITMSIWSEERREGTDELLLTIPASDVDIVLGKFFAAVSIFTVALFFSQLTNFLVLLKLSVGEVDVGLFITTYIGYWFIGIAMLSLGMAASFLTSNLTVSFILGALFNAPLVFLLYADRVIPGRSFAQSISWWSYLARFSDFGRGVISFSSCLYFLLVASVGVYLSIIFIGRRHWQGGRDGKSMLGHYVIRGVAMVLIALGASRFFAYHDWFRFDATSGKVSSISPDTKRLLRGLDTKYPVVVEAFISRSVPEQYVQTRVDLINLLREFDALTGANVQIHVHDNLDTYTDEATFAEDRFGITAQSVLTQSSGTIKQEQLFMGAAFSCGLERVVVPFFDRGIPVEYELVRSITTVANAKRRRIGVLKTDAQMFGGFNMARMSQIPKQAVIAELEKQYDVEEVDPSTAIPEGTYDVLLAVQPSSLNPQGLNNLVTAVRNGQPTAIFEDPYPAMMRQATPTSQPRAPQGGMFGGGRPPEPKGDIRQLWDLLGVDMVSTPPTGGSLVDARIVWQKFNPYENKLKVQDITPEWVFISADAPGVGEDAFNDSDVVSSGLSQLLFLFPGGLRDLGTRKLDFVPLCMTGDESGEIGFMEYEQNRMNPAALEYLRMSEYTKKRYILGARIRGQLGDAFQMSDSGSPLLAQTAGPSPVANDSSADNATDAPAEDESFQEDESDRNDTEDRAAEIHVVYVTDIDLLSSQFIQLRAQPDEQIKWEFDNVTFVLNILDSLAGDEELVGIRKRRTRHSTLKMVSYQTEDARTKALEKIAGFKADFQSKIEATEKQNAEAQQRLEDKINELQERAQTESGAVRRELMAAMQMRDIEEQQLNMKLQRERERLEAEQERELKVIERDLELGIRKVQTGYKLNAAFLPPIPPLLMGLVVWYYRKKREKEGIVASRLR